MPSYVDRTLPHSHLALPPKYIYQIVLADEELAGLIGNTDVVKGKELLVAMKEVRALDQIIKDGRISQEEFNRLHDLTVLEDAAKRVQLKTKVKAMWEAATKDDDGQIERLACWEVSQMITTAHKP